MVLKEVTDQAASLLRNLEMEQEEQVEPYLLCNKIITTNL